MQNGKLRLLLKPKLKPKDLEQPEEASEIVKIHPLSLLLFPLPDLESTFIKLTPRSLGDWEWKKKRVKCMVCWGAIKDDDKNIISCPSCGRMAHRAHITNWLKSKRVCPSCRAPWLYSSSN
ncbi:MAG: RING finger domain-containing protein [Promethearchaeota archaeon]